MKHSGFRGNFFAVAMMALLLALSVSTTSLGKDRHGKGQGKGHDNWSWSKHNRKCGKFVNCHDARDGRWDRRGPRGNRGGNVAWRDRLRNRNLNDHVWLNRGQRSRRLRIDN